MPELILAISFFVFMYFFLREKSINERNNGGIEAAKKALERNNRRSIENVLITYDLPRKVRRSLEKRCEELKIEEIINEDSKTRHL